MPEIPSPKIHDTPTIITNSENTHKAHPANDQKTVKPFATLTLTQSSFHPPIVTFEHPTKHSNQLVTVGRYWNLIARSSA